MANILLSSASISFEVLYYSLVPEWQCYQIFTCCVFCFIYFSHSLLNSAVWEHCPIHSWLAKFHRKHVLLAYLKYLLLFTSFFLLLSESSLCDEFNSLGEYFDLCVLKFIFSKSEITCSYFSPLHYSITLFYTLSTSSDVLSFLSSVDALHYIYHSIPFYFQW